MPGSYLNLTTDVIILTRLINEFFKVGNVSVCSSVHSIGNFHHGIRKIYFKIRNGAVKGSCACIFSIVLKVFKFYCVICIRQFDKVLIPKKKKKSQPIGQKLDQLFSCSYLCLLRILNYTWKILPIRCSHLPF